MNSWICSVQQLIKVLGINRTLVPHPYSTSRTGGKSGPAMIFLATLLTLPDLSMLESNKLSRQTGVGGDRLVRTTIGEREVKASLAGATSNMGCR